MLSRQISMELATTLNTALQQIVKMYNLFNEPTKVVQQKNGRTKMMPTAAPTFSSSDEDIVHDADDDVRVLQDAAFIDTVVGGFKDNSKLLYALILYTIYVSIVVMLQTNRFLVLLLIWIIFITLCFLLIYYPNIFGIEKKSNILTKDLEFNTILPRATTPPTPPSTPPQQRPSLSSTHKRHFTLE